MSDLEQQYTVAEEHILQKQTVKYQRRKKMSDRVKAERAKDRIKAPQTIKQEFDLSRVKRLSDLPDDE